MDLVEVFRQLNRVSMLNEGIADVRQHYPKIDDDTFDKLIALDPTFTADKDKLGNYGKWILNLFNKGKLKEEDFYKVPDYLSEFEQKKKGMDTKDIGQFKSLGDLATALSNAQDVELTQRQKDRQLQKATRQAIKDADLVFDDGKWEVYIPHSFEADRAVAQYKNDRPNHWCTQANERYWEHYSSQGNLYVNIRKSDNEHFQFHFETSSFMDNEDRPVNLFELIKDDDKLVTFYGKIVEKLGSEGKIDIPQDLEQIDFESETIELQVSEDDYEYAIEEAYSGYSRRSADNVSVNLICALISGRDEEIWDEIMSWDVGNYMPTDIVRYSTEGYVKDDIITECERLGITFDDLNSIGNGQDYSDETGEVFDNYDEIREAIFQANFTGAENGVYSELTGLISSSVVDAINNTGMVVNPPSDLFNHDVRKLQVTNPFYGLQSTDNAYYGALLAGVSDSVDYEDYFSDYSNNRTLNRFLSAFSDSFECRQPYYGFDEFDNEAFSDRLLDELQSI